MRKYLVGLALVAVLGLSASASSFTGGQETESPTDLSGSCVSVEGSAEMKGTPDDGTADAGTPAVDGTPDAAGTPEGTPGTPQRRPV